MVVRARNERVRKMRDKTIDVLLQMGVPASIKGFTYICDAIELFDTDPYYPDGKICSLYFEIARLHETTASRVERAIRHAFEVALTKGERDIVDCIWIVNIHKIPICSKHCISECSRRSIRGKRIPYAAPVPVR